MGIGVLKIEGREVCQAEIIETQVIVVAGTQVIVVVGIRVIVVVGIQVIVVAGIRVIVVAGIQVSNIRGSFRMVFTAMVAIRARFMGSFGFRVKVTNVAVKY